MIKKYPGTFLSKMKYENIFSQEAQIALIIADLGGCSDQQRARVVNSQCRHLLWDLVSVSGKATCGLEVFGYSASTSARLCVRLAFGADHHNAHLGVSVSELQTYVTVAAQLHSSKVPMSKMAVTTLTSDCKPTANRNDAGASPALQRTKTGKPKRRTACAGP